MAENDCENPEEHCDLHACQIKPTVTNPEVQKMFENPRFICTNCRRTTHNAENLCRPRPL